MVGDEGLNELQGKHLEEHPIRCINMACDQFKQFMYAIEAGQVYSLCNEEVTGCVRSIIALNTGLCKRDTGCNRYHNIPPLSYQVLCKHASLGHSRACMLTSHG